MNRVQCRSVTNPYQKRDGTDYIMKLVSAAPLSNMGGTGEAPLGSGSGKQGAPLSR